LINYKIEDVGGALIITHENINFGMTFKRGRSSGRKKV
jgi:hypothetical protein